MFFPNQVRKQFFIDFNIECVYWNLGLIYSYKTECKCPKSYIYIKSYGCPEM